MKVQLDAFCYQIVITVNVSSTTNSHILKGPTPFSFMIMWSIWLLVLPSCDFQISLWMSRCAKMVTPITQLLFKQKSTRRSPLSFITPQPCWPMALSQLEFSAPTLAFMSPMIKSMSCCGTLAIACCNRSYQSSLSSLSVSSGPSSETCPAWLNLPGA